MAVLTTVTSYVAAARSLLQDLIAPYRYSDADLLFALNLALLDVRRLRADVFLAYATTPQYSTVDTTTVTLDEQYRLSVVYFMCGYAQLYDDETSQDERAEKFLMRARGVLSGSA